MVKLVNIIGDQTVAANRMLAPDNASMKLVYFQQQKPLVPAELNFAQQIQNENQRNLAANVGRPGFFVTGSFSSGGTSLNIGESWALGNGEVIHVATGTGDTYTGITVPLTPAPASGVSYDVVYLSFWYAEVSALGQPDSASESIWLNGQSGAVDISAQSAYVIRDPLVTAVAETTRRIQLRWRVQVWNSTVLPIGDGLVSNGSYVAPGGMGESGVNNAGFPYTDLSLTSALNNGLYRSGNGDLASATTLKEATGYVYAIPIAIVSHSVGEGNLVIANQVTDKRRSASSIGNVTTEGNNIVLIGDDVIFRTKAGLETGRVIGSAGTPYTIRTQRFQSTVASGTPPLIVASPTMVSNLTAQNLAVGASNTPTVAGNATGNIPVSNGNPNVNLNADMVDGAHVGTGPGNIVVLDTGGSYLGKINPTYIPSSVAPVNVSYLTESRSGSPYTPSNANGHPSSDFLLKNELNLVGNGSSGIPAVYGASYAVSAGSANTANSAATVPVAGVSGGNQGTMQATSTSANAGNTIAYRDGNGDFSARVITATLNGGATYASSLQSAYANSEPLSFSSAQTILILPAGNYSRSSAANSGGGFFQPAISSNAAIASASGLFQFPLEPGRMRLQSINIPVRFKIRGTLFVAALDSPRNDTLGIRVLDPHGNIQYSQTSPISAGGGSSATYTLPSIIGALDSTNVINRYYDGMWSVEIYTSSSPNSFGCGNIYLELYTANVNIGD